MRAKERLEREERAIHNVVPIKIRFFLNNPAPLFCLALWAKNRMGGPNRLFVKDFLICLLFFLLFFFAFSFRFLVFFFSFSWPPPDSLCLRSSRSKYIALSVSYWLHSLSVSLSLSTSTETIVYCMNGFV